MKYKMDHNSNYIILKLNNIIITEQSAYLTLLEHTYTQTHVYICV